MGDCRKCFFGGVCEGEAKNLGAEMWFGKMRHEFRVPVTIVDDPALGLKSERGQTVVESVGGSGPNQGLQIVGIEDARQLAASLAKCNFHSKEHWIANGSLRV